MSRHHEGRHRSLRLALSLGFVGCLALAVVPTSVAGSLPAIRHLYSPTAPVPTHWYGRSYATFTWTPLIGVAGYSCVFDHHPNAVPDTTLDRTPTLCFRGKRDFATGGDPGAILAGDFNGDGKPDLAVGTVADNGASVIDVLLGDGRGGFGRAKAYATGETDAPPGALGDFNKDGKLDLVTADPFGTVTVFLGDGRGGFAGKKRYASAETNPGGLAVGDFSKDGKLDLALTNTGADTVAVLLGDGKGGFAAKTDYATGEEPVALAAADFDGDGNLDLAVVNELGNSVSVLLGDGTGSFAAKTGYATGEKPVALAVADFNGDGRPDLAVTDYGQWGASGWNALSVLLGDGTGGLGPRTDYYTGCAPDGVVAGDFNGDGKADLAVTNSGENPYAGACGTLTTFLGDGIGTFLSSTDYATFEHGRIIGADLDGDGRVDLVRGDPENNRVSVLLSRPVRSKTYSEVRNGLWYFHVRAVDGLGGGGPVASLAVRIDTTPPSTKARPASVYRGRWARLTCAVMDPRPCGGWARVRVWVRDSRRQIVYRLTYAHLRTDVWLYPTFRCWLPRGTYRYFVYATDAAGNTQNSVGSSRLVVR